MQNSEKGMQMLDGLVKTLLVAGIPGAKAKVFALLSQYAFKIVQRAVMDHVYPFIVETINEIQRKCVETNKPLQTDFCEEVANIFKDSTRI